MLATLALALSVTAAPPQPVTPSCTYYRFMTAGIWSALDDAERNRTDPTVVRSLEATLRSVVAKEHRACGVIRG